MAAFPTFTNGVMLDSRMSLESGYQDDFDDGGAQHSVQFHDQQYYQFRVLYRLTYSEWTSLLSTYTAGPRDTYTFTYFSASPSVTYSVKFTDTPQVKDNLGGYYEVEVNLRGYQD